MTRPLPDAELLPHLLRLARKGSYAEASEGDTFAVFSGRNHFAGPLAWLPAPSIMQALTQGLLRQDPLTARVCMTEEGRRAVARALRAAQGGRVRKPPAPAVQRQGTASRTRNAGGAHALRAEGPLAWLRRRKDREGKPLITQAQFDAGERLAADYARARMLPRVTANWSAAAPATRATRAGAGAVDVSDAAIAARDRLYRALAAVGPEIGPLVVDICCHEIGLEQAERTRGWPQRSGKVVLDMGLTALARHYGIIPPQHARDRRAAPRTWREEGYAPTLDLWL